MAKDHYFNSIDGLRLYYREYGSRGSPGPTLVCLPGLTRNGLGFEDLALYLEEKGFRVLCPDYRGRGNSACDPNWRNYKIPVYITDLQNMMFRARVMRCSLIGGSLGGMLSITMGAMMPALFSSIILNDVGPDLDEEGFATLIDNLSKEHGHDSEAAAIAHLKKVQAHLNIKNDEGWAKYARRLYREDDQGRFNLNWDKELLKALGEGAGGTDLWPLFRKLKSLPILLIRGEISEVLSKETADRMESEHPNLQQIVVPDVGHLPVLDEPGLPEAIAEFIEKNATPKNPFFL